MAKYYIQSGSLKAVLDSDDSEKAALWAVHRVMQQIAPVYDETTISCDEKQAMVEVDGLLTLGDAIRISETGFDSAEVKEYVTYDLVVQWHQLMIDFDKLQKLL